MYADTLVSLFRDAYQSIRPLTIEWQGQQITIVEIGYLQKLQEGQTVRHVFSATDGSRFYELIFDELDVPFLTEYLLGR